ERLPRAAGTLVEELGVLVEAFVVAVDGEDPGPDPRYADGDRAGIADVANADGSPSTVGHQEIARVALFPLRARRARAPGSAGGARAAGSTRSALAAGSTRSALAARSTRSALAAWSAVGPRGSLCSDQLREIDGRLLLLARVAHHDDTRLL